MYSCIETWYDLQDNDHQYYKGDTFPREGLKVTEERLEELSTDKNKRGIPLIQKDNEDKPLEKMTKAELEAKAQEMDIDISKAKNNEERVKLLKGEG